MRTLLVTLRFDGRGFCGWQVQKNGPTIMAAFQDALASVLGSRPGVKGCSRTDSGVHALGYCVSFSTDSSIPCERLTAALNARLPRSVAAVSCREMAEGFHARYDALGKRYRYRILNAPARDPFWEGLAWHIPRPLDAGALDRAAQSFVGIHDFSAFCSAGSSVAGTTRAIFSFEAVRRGELLELAVEGNGFLYNMVRIMVGTLVDLDGGVLPAGSLPAILDSHDRARAGRTAPAHGLYLERVFYPFDPPPERS